MTIPSSVPLPVPPPEPEPERVSGRGVLRLRLGQSLSCPPDRMATDLHAVAGGLNRARNAMMRAWLRWHEDHPDQSVRRPVEGEKVPQCRFFPATLPREPWMPGRADKVEVSGRVWLYHHGRRECPCLNTNLISAAAGEVVSDLQARTPHGWCRTGKRAFYNWQAILWYEKNAESYGGRNVPVPKTNAALLYDGILRCHNAPDWVENQLRSYGPSACVLALPLFSPEAGRDNTYLFVRLDSGDMTAGQRNVLERIVAGEWNWEDSSLVFKEARHNAFRGWKTRGTWYYHLSFDQPPESGPNPNRRAVLTWNRAGFRHPFHVCVDEAAVPGRRPVAWDIGRGPLLCSIYRRLEARRRVTGQGWELAGSGRRGHGHQRRQRDERDVVRKVRDFARDALQQAVAEVLRFCKRFDCGVLVWEPPPMTGRQGTWFAAERIQWDWTTWQNRLVNACARGGVRLAGTADEGL